MDLKNNKKHFQSDFLSKFNKESESVYRLKSQSFNFEETINVLIKNSKFKKLKNVRICIHPNDNSRIQHMIIFHSKDYNVPIHRHCLKSEFLKIHKGSCTYNYYQFLKGKFVKNKLNFSNSNC